MKKIIALIMLCLFSNLYSEVRISLGGGLLTAGYAYLMEDPSFTFVHHDNMGEAINALYYGEVDVVNLPLSTALKVYKERKDFLKILGVSGYFNSTLVSSDTHIRRLSHLLGKTIYVRKNSFGHSFLLWLLDANEIPVGEGNGLVNIEFMERDEDIACALLQGSISVGLIDNEYASLCFLRSPNCRKAIDLQDQYETICGIDRLLPYSVLVTSKASLQDKAFLLNDFLTKYEDSVHLVIKKRGESLPVLAKNELGINSPSILHSLKNSYLGYENVSSSKLLINSFIDIHNFNKDLPSFSYPGKDLYY